MCFCDFVYKGLVQTLHKNADNLQNRFLRLRLQRLGSNNCFGAGELKANVSATSFTKAWFKRDCLTVTGKTMGFCDFVYKGLVQTYLHLVLDLLHEFLRLRLQRLGSNNWKLFGFFQPSVSATSFTKAWFKLPRCMRYAPHRFLRLRLQRLGSNLFKK